MARLLREVADIQETREIIIAAGAIVSVKENRR